MLSDFNSRVALAGVISGLSAAGLWAIVVYQQWPRLLLGNTLCSSGDGGVFSHCPACYPALALTLLSAAAFTAWATRVRAQPASL
jgi:hypothetical protein